MYVRKSSEFSFHATPLKNEGHIALHMVIRFFVGRYVGIPDIMKQMTQESIISETSYLMGQLDVSWWVDDSYWYSGQ